MVKPMAITEEMKDTHKIQVDELVTTVNNSINRAVKHGVNKTCFSIGKHNTYYSEVRSIFESAGYTIKPTGYIGGVWQLTEDICW